MEKLLPFFVLFALVLTSCKKEDPEEDETPTPNLPVVVNDHYVVIDTLDQQLISTQLELDSGVYVFQVNGGDIANVNDLIVGTEGAGFLRRVTAVNQNGNQVSYETVFANMHELFTEGDIDFTINLNDSYQYRSLVSHPITNHVLINNSGVIVEVDGNMTLDISQIYSELSFDTSGLERLIFETVGAEFNANLTIAVTANGNLPLLNIEDTLAGFKKKFVHPGPFGIPIVGLITTDFIIKSSVNIAANANTSVSFENNSPIDFGIRYENGSWQADIDFNPNNNFSYVPLSGGVQTSYNVELAPVIDVQFYGVGGPYGSVSLLNSVEAEVASPSLDWNFGTSVWMESTIGVHADIFGFNLLDYSTTWTSQSLDYRTPYELTKVSGDHQNGPAGTALSNPLRVQVLDETGNGQSNVPVYFTVTQGGGSVSTSNILTDANGVAETMLTPGSGAPQVVSVTAKKGDLGPLQSAPQVFMANANLSVQQRLDLGETPIQIYNSGISVDSLYLKDYAGGGIFYLNTSTGEGLVFAQTSTSVKQWTDGTFVLTGANATAVGTGLSNTLSIVSAQGAGTYAAQETNDFVHNGYSDWHLPSRDELQALRNNWAGIGFAWGPGGTEMWSSSESSIGSAWAFDPGANTWAQRSKSSFITTPYVRAF